MSDAASDIRRGGWMERWAPRAWGPYLRLSRLDRAIGTWLLLLPGWWAIALAAEGWPDLRLLALFAVGAVAMRGAGCTFNDIVDRDFDARVARTRLRPLPSGEVTVRQAAMWMAAQLAVGAAVLFSLTPTAILLGVGVLVLIGTYPFMKRVTWWPQLFLGLNFNWGALVGWAAVTDRIEAPAVLLYVGGIFWTLGYDTIYAHQDKEDDALIGVKSSALVLGSRTRPFLFLVYAVAAGLWAAAGLGHAWPFWAALAGVTAHLFWQAARVDTDSATDCLQKFRSNRDLGLLLFAGIVLGKLV